MQDEHHRSDRWFMHQALALADNALYTATPNPRVGCVIARDGAMIGSGWTQAYGSKEERDGAIASGMDQGMEAGYQQLDAVLAQAV